MRFSCPFRVFSPRTRRPRRRPPASCPSSRPPRYRRLTHNGARRAARQAEHPGGWSSLNAPREELSDVRQLADRIGADITMDSRDRGRECCSPMERGVRAQRLSTLALDDQQKRHSAGRVASGPSATGCTRANSRWDGARCRNEADAALIAGADQCRSSRKALAALLPCSGGFASRRATPL
jgi:hypothetical protein